MFFSQDIFFLTSDKFDFVIETVFICFPNLAGEDMCLQRPEPGRLFRTYGKHG